MEREYHKKLVLLLMVHQQVLEIKIKPEAVDPDDIEMLQDLIIAAYNDANTQVEETLREKLGTMAVGMPNLF